MTNVEKESHERWQQHSPCAVLVCPETLPAVRRPSPSRTAPVQETHQYINTRTFRHHTIERQTTNTLPYMSPPCLRWYFTKVHYYKYGFTLIIPTGNILSIPSHLILHYIGKVVLMIRRHFGANRFTLTARLDTSV